MKKILWTFVLLNISISGFSQWFDSSTEIYYDYQRVFNKGSLRLTLHKDTLIDNHPAQILNRTIIFDDEELPVIDYKCEERLIFVDSTILYAYPQHYGTHSSIIIDTLYKFNTNVGDGWTVYSDPLTNTTGGATVTGKGIFNGRPYLAVVYTYTNPIGSGSFLDTIIWGIGNTHSSMFAGHRMLEPYDAYGVIRFQCFRDQNYSYSRGDSCNFDFSRYDLRCEIDAGDDITVCLPDDLNEVKLNGIGISGEFISVKWEALHYDTFLNEVYPFTSSFMLNDTSIIQPTIQEYLNRSQTYYLTGTTKNNAECSDSVTVHFSKWAIPTTERAVSKSPRDTITLKSYTLSNWPHTKHTWTPNFMISDASSPEPFVWNDVTTFYHLTITDSLGCTFQDDVFQVFVSTTNTENVDFHQVEVYPNPVRDILHLNKITGAASFELISLDGHKILKTNENKMNLSDLPPGSYILTVIYKNRPSMSQLVQKTK